MADESGGASIDKLTISISATSSRAAKSIENLSQSLASLKMALTGVPGNLNALSASLNSLKEASAGVNSFASAIKALKSGFSGNALAQNAEKIGQAMLKLDKYIKPLDTSISSLAKSAAEINTLMKSISQAFSEAGTSADSAAKKMNVFQTSANSAYTASNRVNQLTGSVSKLKRATGGNALGKIFSGLKTAVSVVAIMRLGKAIAHVAKQSTDYIESLNLFTVSMGKYAEQGEMFAERISTALGIDQGEALKNMGLFNNLATSFGVSSDQAYILSKNLTQLAYDFASFHNLDIEDSFLKFQSALAGELEPIRRVGVDISNARLQQELYELGIRRNITTLNRADKALLTYIAIMKQASNEMGDMARTITTPANMLRVLQNQFVITARSIGNIFIPALQVVLPWVIAFVKVIGQAASALAAFFGFEMPDFSSVSNSVDMSGVAAQFDTTGDAAEGASKKLNQLIGGFDELNIMQSKSSGASAGAEAIGSVLGGLDLSGIQYDMLEGIVGKNADKYVRKIAEFFRAFKNSGLIKTAADMLKFLWEKAVKPMGEWIISHPDVIANLFKTIGVALLTYGIVQGITRLVTGFKALNTTLASGGLIGILKSLGGIFTNPWALAIAAVAAAITAVGLAMWQASEDARKARLTAIFGDIALTFDEVKQAAESLATTELSIKLDAYDSGVDTLKEIRENLANTITELQTQQWLASIGVDIDLEAYSVNIDNLISQTQDALNQQEHVYMMAISIGVSGENVSAEMTDFVSKYMNSSRSHLESLGKQLREQVDNALADGVLSGDELNTITNLQTEMQEVMDRVSKAEYSAKWTAFTLDWSGVDLTFESWSDVMSSAQDMIEERISELEGIRLQNLKIAELALAEGQITPEKYDSWVEEIENTFQQNKLSLTATLDEFAIDTLGGSYQKVIEQFGDEASNDVLEAFNSSWETALDGTKNFNVSKFMDTLEYEIKQGLPGLQASVTSILENIKPQEDEWKAQKAYYEEKGMEVPESITAGLKSVEQLRALGNGTDGMYKAIRDTIENSNEVKKALEEAGLSANELTGTVLDGILSGYDPISEAGKGLVTEASNSIVKKSDNEQTGVENAGKGIMESFWNGLKSTWNKITQWIGNLNFGNITGEISVNTSKTKSVSKPGSISKFASGNIATEPTLALFGEYPNAAHNPEVTAPQSTIYETVVSANGEMVAALYQMASMIVQAIEDNSVEVSADSKEIFKVVKKEADGYRRTHGASAF